ncbi:MAG: hypothetical protein ACYC99_08955 [Candidatus Geothermincolia bacterium]
MALVDIAIRATDNASKVMKSVGDNSGKAAKVIADHWKGISAATAGAGAAVEGLARNQAPLTEMTRNLAASVGLSEGKMRDLVRSTSDVGFSLDEVIQTMQAGREQGLKSANDLKTYASFWDEVADAAGGVPQDLAKAGVSLNAIGIEAGDSGKATAALGFIIRDTTQTVDQFLAFVGKAGPQLRTMGLDVDDTAAMFGILERELGLSGRVAKAQFAKAVNESGGSLEKMLDTLGISNQTFEEYRGRVAASNKVIEQQAANNDKSFTLMQKMNQTVKELTYKYGDLIETMGSLSMPLMGVSAAIGIMGKLGSIITGVFKAGPGFIKNMVSTIKSLPTVFSLVKQQGLMATLQAGKLWPALSKVAGRVKDLGGKIAESGIKGFHSIMDSLGGLSLSTASKIAGVTGAVAALSAAIVIAVDQYAKLQKAWAEEKASKENEKEILRQMYERGQDPMDYMREYQGTFAPGTAVELLRYIEELKKNPANPAKEWARTTGRPEYVYYTEGPGATKMAKGGIVTKPTFAMIGEAGPEAVVPLDGNRSGGVVRVEHSGVITIKGADAKGQIKEAMPLIMRGITDQLHRELRGATYLGSGLG